VVSQQGAGAGSAQLQRCEVIDDQGGAIAHFVMVSLRGRGSKNEVGSVGIEPTTKGL
jgi:hypothetical protein